jgi:hypothetical protein
MSYFVAFVPTEENFNNFVCQQGEHCTKVGNFNMDRWWLRTLFFASTHCFFMSTTCNMHIRFNFMCNANRSWSKWKWFNVIVINWYEMAADPTARPWWVWLTQLVSLTHTIFILTFSQQVTWAQTICLVRNKGGGLITKNWFGSHKQPNNRTTSTNSRSLLKILSHCYFHSMTCQAYGIDTHFASLCT